MITLTKESTSQASTEMQLLIACARTQLKPIHHARVQELLEKGINWERLLNLASMHKIVPLLYNCLNVADGANTSTIHELRGMAQAIGIHNLFLTQELKRVLHSLEEIGIPALPFKGPILAATVYGNLSLRQYNDLDILVHKRDFFKAKDFLLTKGFRSAYDLTEEQEENFQQTQLRRKDGLIVEIQWGFTPKHLPFRIDPNKLWQRQRPVSLMGSLTPSLSPEDMLLILCVHGAKHGWERLSWICDIAEFLRTYPDINWSKMLNLAQDVNCERMLGLGLFLAYDLLEAPVPHPILQWLESDRRILSLSHQVEDRILLEKGTGPFELSSFHLNAIDSVLDRSFYHLYIVRRAMALNEKDVSFMRLPPLLSSLYYLVRPIRLVWEYGWKKKQ